MNNQTIAQWLKVRVVSEAGHLTAYGAQVHIYDAETKVRSAASASVDAGQQWRQEAYDVYFGLTRAAERGTRSFDLELTCGGRSSLTKLDDPKLGGVAPNQLLVVKCPSRKGSDSVHSPARAKRTHVQKTAVCATEVPVLIKHGQSNRDFAVIEHESYVDSARWLVVDWTQGIFFNGSGVVDPVTQWILRDAGDGKVHLVSATGKHLSTTSFSPGGPPSGVEFTNYLSSCQGEWEAWTLQASANLTGLVTIANFQGWCLQYFLSGRYTDDKYIFGRGQCDSSFAALTITLLDGSPACSFEELSADQGVKQVVV